ncbi:hypothetical protein HOY80DRAFT_1039045 [Tuber brumale]|nr:hypothetical protein HOY80DRAFT_1039045 [Tuber brumale]
MNNFAATRGGMTLLTLQSGPWTMSAAAARTLQGKAYAKTPTVKETLARMFRMAGFIELRNGVCPGEAHPEPVRDGHIRGIGTMVYH